MKNCQRYSYYDEQAVEVGRLFIPTAAFLSASIVLPSYFLARRFKNNFVQSVVFHLFVIQILFLTVVLRDNYLVEIEEILHPFLVWVLVISAPAAAILIMPFVNLFFMRDYAVSDLSIEEINWKNFPVFAGIICTVLSFVLAFFLIKKFAFF